MRGASSVAHVAGNLIPLVTGLVTAPLTARALAPEGRGDVAVVVTAVSIFIVVASFGLGWVAREEVAMDPRSYHFWRRRSRGIALIALPVAVGLAALLAMLLSFNAVETGALALYLAIAAFAGTRSVDGNILVSLGRPGSLGVINSLAAIAILVSCVTLFALEWLTVASVMFANALGLIVQMIGLILAIRLVKRARPELAASLHFIPESGSSSRSVVRRSGRAWASQLTDAYMLRADTIVVALTATRVNVGYYSVAALVPQVGFALCLTIVQRAFARARHYEPDRRLRVVTQACLLVGVLFLCIALPAAYLLIPPIFGEEFVEARSFLLSAGVMTLGLAGLAGGLMDAARRGGRGAWLAAIVLLPSVAAGIGALNSPQTAVTSFGIFALLAGLSYGCAHVGIRLFLPDVDGLRRVLWRG